MRLKEKNNNSTNSFVLGRKQKSNGVFDRATTCFARVHELESNFAQMIFTSS